MLDLLDAPQPPDAVLATMSLLGVGAVEALQERRIAPPDIGLASFGGAPWSRLIRPALTTVWQPARELGREAAELLLQRTEDHSLPERGTVLSMTLEVAASTARRPRDLSG
jgi:LacI family transcriptional regulator